PALSAAEGCPDTNHLSPARDRSRKGTAMKKLTRNQRREIAAIAKIRDEDIDLSEMPEVVDWSGAEVGRFYRPPKRPVTMRRDADVIEWLKSYGPGYQTKANLPLRHAMKSTQQIDPAPKRRRA